MTVVKRKKKEEAIKTDPYLGNSLLIDPDLLNKGWTRLCEESLPEYGGDFYIRNGFEVISKGLRMELKRLGYGCLLFRWPGDTGLSNRLTFVFVPRSTRVGVSQRCIIGMPKMSYLKFDEKYPLIEVHQHKYGFGWRLNHGAIADVRDVTKFTPFYVIDPGYDRVSFTKNLPIYKFLDPDYRKPIKRPKIIKEI
ncbi:MAG: hypothetical protein Q4A70_04065 [Candidatus Saccharibacteria bacterium]|nr:hypothetical protein [Candidatus Saccharibacteria bacterium]